MYFVLKRYLYESRKERKTLGKISITHQTIQLVTQLSTGLNRFKVQYENQCKNNVDFM